MLEEPQDPQPSDIPDDPNLERGPDFLQEVSQSEPPEEKAGEPEPPPMPSDYVSEIRQSLVTEETSRPKSLTGRILRRFTGTLRRVTGPLQPPEEQKEEKGMPSAEPAQPELADDFLADRLGGATAAEPPPILLPESWGDLSASGVETDAGVEASELLQMEEDQVESRESASIETASLVEPEPEYPLGDDEPISLLESGAIAALGLAEEAAEQEAEPDWMDEIRRSAAEQAGEPQPGAEEQNAGPEPDLSSGEPRSPRGTTSQLRSFLSNILGRSAEKQKGPDESAFPDELVTGRLERSLGAAEENALAAGEGYAEEETAQVEPGGPQDAAVEDSFDNQFTFTQGPAAVEEEDSFLQGLEVSFGSFGEPATEEEAAPYQLFPEDENLLWGEASPPAAAEPKAQDTPFSFDQIWGNQGGEAPAYNFEEDLRREIWGDEAAPRSEEPEPQEPEIPLPGTTAPLNSEDVYAAAYLANTDELPPIQGNEEEEVPAEDLLGKALNESERIDNRVSMEDLRAIALENYEEEEGSYADWPTKIDWGDEEQVAVDETLEESLEETREAAPAGTEPHAPTVGILREEAGIEAEPGWKSWLASAKITQKILLVEGALVAVAMLVAVPLFVYLIASGGAKRAAQPVTRTLPANLPYPTGLTLPGGWYFPLEKSNVADGKWKPVTNEWLEGSELRRVVALPWNAQTEAVIRTFHAGDAVEIALSNSSTLQYKVASVERVPVGDTRVFSDIRPSLAIILYREKDSSRWVVICRP